MPILSFLVASFLRALPLGVMALGVMAVIPAHAVDMKAVLATYADIAHAEYEDALIGAQTLDKALKELSSRPSMRTLEAARVAWLSARIPYQQTEVYRFGNAIVDDWEGKVNAWPLDEGLIDYVDASYGSEKEDNPLYTANVIANPTVMVNGKPVDARKITPSLLEDLHEAGGLEANVTTGYHAIEFLLWGQDLNGTKAGAGNRPYTDFDIKNCTGGHCDRRIDYLHAASELLISDLKDMVNHWSQDGAARRNVMKDNLKQGIVAMLTGMGSLSYGEMAGERMRLGLMLHDPEEEHDCFSDNTHNSHLYNAIGMRNVYLGRYRRTDGSMVRGPSLSQLVASADSRVDAELKRKLDITIDAMRAIAQRAENGESYDQQIGPRNSEGNGRVQAAIDALIEQTRSIDLAVAALDLRKIEFEGSDSLDNPRAVFQ